MEYQEERSLYGQRVKHGKDNLKYLKAHTNFLTHFEKKVTAKFRQGNGYASTG